MLALKQYMSSPAPHFINMIAAMANFTMHANGSVGAGHQFENTYSDQVNTPR